MNRVERRELGALIRTALNAKVRDFEYPGGKSRDSVRVILQSGKSVIATKRKTEDRATRELSVLQRLRDSGGAVPNVYAYNGKFLLQQDVGKTRLSQTLHDDNPSLPIEAQLDAALGAMADCHAAARSSGLQEELPVIGAEADWREAFANVPHELGEMIGITPPDYAAEPVAELFSVIEPAFVKWDSRPGNALMGANGKCYWFDWEHCGRRNSLDDFVWLMADEFVTHDAEMQDRLAVNSPVAVCARDVARRGCPICQCDGCFSQLCAP